MLFGILDISFAVWHLTKLWKSLYFPVSLVPLIEQMLKRICESRLDSCVRAHSLYNSNASSTELEGAQPAVTRDNVDLIWGMGTWTMSFLYLYYFNVVLAVLKDLFKTVRWWRGMRLQKSLVSTKPESETNQGEGGRALT